MCFTGNLRDLSSIICIIQLNFQSDLRILLLTEKCLCLELSSPSLSGIHSSGARTQHVVEQHFCEYSVLMGLAQPLCVCCRAELGWKDNIQEEEGPAFKNRNGRALLEVFARTPTQGSVPFYLLAFCNKIEFHCFCSCLLKISIFLQCWLSVAATQFTIYGLNGLK